MGSTSLAAGLAIPSQTNPTADPGGPLLTRNPILFNGKLPAIQKGGRDESRECRREQDQGTHL